MPHFSPSGSGVRRRTRTLAPAASSRPASLASALRTSGLVPASESKAMTTGRPFHAMRRRSSHSSIRPAFLPPPPFGRGLAKHQTPVRPTVGNPSCTALRDFFSPSVRISG